MTERYTYGFRIDYKFSRHIIDIVTNHPDSLDIFAEKGITISNSGTKSNKYMTFYLADVSASEAVKRLLWALTHLAVMLNDFNGKSLDFLAMKLITEAIRNLLVITDGKGIRLKEWFKNDKTMRVVIFGDADSKLFVALDRVPKNPRDYKVY